MKTAVTVTVIFMTIVCNVYTENNTTNGTTENSIVNNATETESQVTQIMQNKDINDSVINHSDENQELSDSKEPTYSSAREIAKKNLYTLVKIRLLGNLLQRLPIEKRQSIFINALKKVSISGNEKSSQNGIAKAFSMQHRRFDNSNENGSGSQESTENGSGSQESTEKDTDKGTENVLPSDNKNQESFDQETEMQLQVIKHQVSNDVKDLLKTVFPGVDSNSQSAGQGHYTHTTNHNQHYDSDFASKEANRKYVTPVIVSVTNPAQKQSTHPVYVPTPSFVSRSPYSEDHPLKQVRNNDQLSPGLRPNPVLPPSTTPFTIYQSPSLEVDPIQETLNLQPVTFNDYSAELPSSVTFLGEQKHDKMSKPDAKNKEGHSELFELYNSNSNEETTQSKNAHFVENDLSNSSEEKSVDNYNYHTTLNLQDMNVYPSSDVQDYYEDNFLTSDKTNVEEAVQMIYNLFNDYDDHVFDYENEKLNLDVELRPSTTLSPLATTQGYTFRANKSSFTAYPFAENPSTPADDNDVYNSRESVEDVNTLKHDITNAPRHGSGEIHPMIQKKTKVQKEGNDKPSSDNSRSQEMKESKLETSNNYFYVEDFEGNVTTQMHNINNKVPDSSSEEIVSSNVVHRYQLQNGNAKSKEPVEENENKEQFSSEMEATLPPKFGKNLFPLSPYDANKKTSEYKKTIINDKGIHDSRQHPASDSKDSGSSEELTLYNLLEKPFLTHSKYGVSKKDILSYERKFGFDSEEYGRDGGDGSKEDSYEFILQENHILNPYQPQRSSPLVLAKYSNRGENNSQHKFSLSDKLTTSRPPAVYFEKSALFPLQYKSGLYSVSSSESEGSNSAAQEENSSPLENLIGDEKRNGHHSSDESRSSMHIDEYEMKQLLGELDRNLNNIIKDATTYQPNHTLKDASSSEELRTDGLGKDSSSEHKLVSSSQSTENLFDSLLKEWNISGVEKALNSDSKEKANVHKHTTIMDTGSTNNVEKQQFQESDHKSDSSESLSSKHTDGGDSAIQIKHISKGALSTEYGNKESSEEVSCDGGICDSGVKSSESSNRDIDSHNTIKGINSADSTEDNKQLNVDVHYQSNGGEKIKNRNNNENNMIFSDSQSHENDDSLAMHKNESITSFNGNGNSKDASSSSEELSNAIKKDISESIEKFKNEEDASNNKQEKSSESQSTDHFDDLSVESILNNKDDGSDSNEFENNISSTEYDSLDTESSSKNIEFKFTNDNSMTVESKEDASETSDQDSNSEGLVHDYKINESQIDSSDISQQKLVDDSMDEGSISYQIKNHFDVDSSLESKSVSEEKNDKESFSTEFKNHISSEENALSSDSSLEDNSILKDKADNLLSKETEHDYNLPGDKSSSCEEHCESSSIEQDLFEKTQSSENESSEQNILTNKDYLPQEKNSESEQVMTSTKVNLSEESGQTQVSEENENIKEETGKIERFSKMHENEYVSNNDDEKNSDESRQESKVLESEENISNDSEQAKNENPKNLSTETTENYSAEIPEEPTPSSDEKYEDTNLQYIVEKVSGNGKRGQQSGDDDDSEQAKYEDPKPRSTETTEIYSAEIPEEPTPSSEEKKEETKLQYIVEKVSENGKRGQQSGDDDDSEQAKNDNPKHRSTETTENYSAEIPEEPTPSSEEKKEETKLQYIVEKVSENEERGQESGDVDKSENEQNNDYIKLIVDKSVFDANIDGDDSGNGMESREETKKKIIESSENGNDYKSEERDKIKVEKIQTNKGNSEENKNKQSHEILYGEPKRNEDPKQKHESSEKNVNKAKHDPNGNSKENDNKKDDPADENKKDENKNEYQEDNKQKKNPNCDEKTNDENKKVDDYIITKEIRNDNDLEKAVEMISDMFVFDFDGSNRKKHTDYVSGKNVNTDSGYGKVGRVRSLIQKLVHLKKLWWKTKYGSKTSRSSSSSVYGSGDLSRLNMKLPTLKNNLHENSNRRSFYGKKIHSNFGSFLTRQQYHQPSFLLSSNYGSRGHYDRRPLAPYRPTLSKYLRGERQIYSALSSNSRYRRPSSYGSRKLKISFGDNGNDYDESQTGLSRLSGILTKKPRTGVYGSRIGYDDSLYSRHDNVRNIGAHIFDSVDDFTNNDEDVIVHPVVTKSNY